MDLHAGPLFCIQWDLSFSALVLLTLWLALYIIWDLFLLFLGDNTIGIVSKDSWPPLTVSTLNALAPPRNVLLAPSLSITGLSEASHN